MPTLDDELLWCPDNDGHIVDSLALGQALGQGNECLAATADDGNAAAMLEMQQQMSGNSVGMTALQNADLPSTSACDQLNNIAQLPDDPEFLGQLTELESLFGENLFPVSLADIKEENNNDLSLDDEQDYLANELPSSSSNNNNSNANLNLLNINGVLLQTQQQLLGLQVLVQQQQQQQQSQNNHRYSTAANPLLVEKLSAPSLTNLDSLANGNRGRPPDNKGKSFAIFFNLF